MAAVALTAHAEIGRAIEEALGFIPVESILRDKIVAIHPNDTMATDDDTSAVTQPDTLEAVIRYVKRFQPRELIVSGGSGALETEAVFRASGMMAVVEREGVAFVDHNKPPFATIPLDYGPMREVVVHEGVLRYETVISLSQLKVHSQSVIVGAIKNIAMSWPAADYYGHPRMGNKYGRSGMVEDKNAFIAGMLQRFRPHLGIVTGHPAMIATGPTGGVAIETGLVVAGVDPVAVDTVCASLLGFSTLGVEYLRQAIKLGLGEGDLKRIEIKGLGLDEAMRIFNEKAYGVRRVLKSA
ncbi:MAG: DUF362 domain-containing protein [Nitrospirae bacterium]|nr:DUF362 domain-containing protein [Candidatus Manganitrophaceae bacterium]